MPKPNNIGEFLDKVPPQDLEAERCLLGSLLLANEAVDIVDPIVSVSSFYADAHRRIYSAIYDLYQLNRKSSVDAVTLRDELSHRVELDVIGGVPYILQLLETVPHAEHAEFYAKIVSEKFRQRQVIEACTESLKDAYHGNVRALSVIESTERKLALIMGDSVIEVASAEASVNEMVARMCRTIENDGAVEGVRISWGPLRDMIDSFAESCLNVLAARPSQGKTAFMLDCALTPAMDGESVLVISLEMSRVELTQRFVSRLSGVPFKEIRSGIPRREGESIEAMEARQADVMDAVDRFKQLPIRIVDGRMNIAQLKQIVRKEYRVHGTRFVLIDYLQLLDISEHMLKSQPTHQVGEMTRELKLLAKELKIPFLLLSQLNRGVEMREDKTPRLSDLRDSGAIEQDADVVIFLHRPESYRPEDMPGIAVLSIAKNRPIGKVYLNYDKTCGRFYVAEEQLKLGYDSGF